MLKNILAIVDCGDNDAQFVKNAEGFARRYDAYLTLLIVSTIPSPDYELELHEPYVRLSNFMERLKAKQERLSSLVHDGGSELRTLQAVTPSLIERVPVHARYSDLVLFGPDTAYRSPWLRKQLVEAVAMNSGRPLLMVPDAYTPRKVHHLAVGWNASREATRAVNDSLILAVPGARIDVMTINAHPHVHGHGDQPGADIALHLAKHGFAVDVVNVSSAEGSTSEALIDHANDRKADLLVIGAYAHSRLRNFILGGVTLDLMPGPPILTLFSH